MYINLILTWVMFIGMIPLSIFWIRRGIRVALKKDHDKIVLKKGKSPVNLRKYILPVILVNLTAGLIIATVVVFIVAAGIDYNTWTAVAGMTIWGKLFADFIISRHAHWKA